MILALNVIQEVTKKRGTRARRAAGTGRECRGETEQGKTFLNSPECVVLNLRSCRITLFRQLDRKVA